MKVVRTRFAPSPTGFLHVGGIRTALFNYLLANQRGGQFILRLEDTDRQRFVPEAIEQIVDGLAWLGLKPDDGFWISGGTPQNIDYIQSNRQKSGTYQKLADKLVGDGLAYYSPTTTKELENLRLQASKAKKPFLYRRVIDGNNSDKLLPNVPIRLNIEALKRTNVEWQDEIRGKFADSLTNIEDFIIIKSDGFPTYNFANVIDDHQMNISHIIRGEEFISSTGKYGLLYDIFKWNRPKFIHLPVINGSDGKKLSKRTGDTNVLEYRDKGYLPEALLNFLALLGWNPGDGSTQEIFSRDELVKAFSLKAVNKSPAIFDQKRLDWINGQYIRQLTIDKLFVLSQSFWPKQSKHFDDSYKKAVLALVQERLKFLAELPQLTNFFFEDLPIDHKLITNHKQLSKLSKDELKSFLRSAKQILLKSDFSVTDLTNKLNELLKITGQKPVVLFSLIRIASTQASASPQLADTLAVLGKERSLKRIESTVNEV